jgi:DNA uptake protein ComE-like DNA-binding protein
VRLSARHLPAVLAAALAAVTVAARPRVAVALEYEVPILVDDEEGLYELRATEQISDETLEALVELYQRGVDLNRAGRDELYALPGLSYAEVDAILSYRDTAGGISDPADLVSAGVLSQAQLESIAAFLVVRPAGGSLFATDGRLKLQSRWSKGDDGVPASAFQARVSTLQNLTLGVAAVVTRTRLGDVRYDPLRHALSAEPPSARPALPKLFARWDTATWGAIAGSYRIGFGQRLTFDNTRLYTPNGFVVDDQILRELDLVLACKESDGELGEGGVICDPVRITPDYRWQDGLLGVAVTLKHLPVGVSHLQATGFASRQARDLYQYQLYDAATCDDPRRDDDEACKAPDVFIRQGDPLAPAGQYKFYTLPDMFAETTVGGNLGWGASRRDRIGVTAFTTSTDFLAEGMDLDFQEWARFPRGGRYGAVGVDGALGVGPVDVFAEVTRSFDAIPGEQGGGGGLGAIVRAVISPGKRDELELSLRSYGEDFINPSARAISAPDLRDGLRARDELGARLRYGGVVRPGLSVRAFADLWKTPSLGIWSFRAQARVDQALTDQVGVGVSLKHHNKDLDTGGHDECFEDAFASASGEPVPCAGQLSRAAARVRFTPRRGYSATAEYEHTVVDDRLGDSFRQDGSAIVTFSALPIETLGIRARSRYYDIDLGDAATTGSFLGSYLELRARVRPRDWLRLRYDVINYFGGKLAGLISIPTEHMLWLSYEARY